MPAMRRFAPEALVIKRVSLGAACQMRALLDALVAALWPGRCAASGVLLQPGEQPPLCAPFAQRLQPAGRIHPAPRGIDAAFALYDYDEPLSYAIRRWKYAQQQWIGEGLAAHLDAALPALLDRWPGTLGTPPISVVPIPLHASRLRERGFEQTRPLARAAVRALRRRYGPHGAHLRTDALRRVRQTSPQAGLCREARLANVLDVFHVERPLIGAVCLVDDVVTTGATAAAAASALRARGATRVALLSVARALAPVRSDNQSDDGDRPYSP